QRTGIGFVPVRAWFRGANQLVDRGQCEWICHDAVWFLHSSKLGALRDERSDPARQIDRLAAPAAASRPRGDHSRKIASCANTPSGAAPYSLRSISAEASAAVERRPTGR